uniref:Uncharacterized protein n=1 Tax=Lepeophtheirus salmonis TaxID=72036 RepID=A0A0K2TBK4_LEPSM
MTNSCDTLSHLATMVPISESTIGRGVLLVSPIRNIPHSEVQGSNLAKKGTSLPTSPSTSRRSEMFFILMRKSLI